MEYVEPISRFDPDLMEELKGLAEGSRFELAEILALNARSEITLNARMLDSRVLDACTAFAALGRATVAGTTVLCQNWDWRATQREALVLLLIERPGRPSITMLTEAGIIGKIGYNSTGLGVCLNAIVTDQVDAGKVPLHIVLRGILEARNLGEAIGAVGRAGIASAANFLVAQHGNGAVDIEAVPSDFDILLPERDVLSHTNHLVSPRLMTMRDLGKYTFPDSYPRLARVRRLLDERYGQIDTEAAKSILRDHANQPNSICRHENDVDPEGKRMQSVASLVMDLAEGSLQVTDGPPCCGMFAGMEREVAALAV
jgi:isopenicillin-N N-acyltransferase-like protein